MDDIARHNQERWEELVQAGVAFSRPWLDLDEALARHRLDPEGLMGEVAGREVLCLAASGGQQSVAFGLLGAKVTVLDFCAPQLERDRETARHYGLEIATIQGDMRDLSPLADDSLDLVWQAHSLNFVPDKERVFDEVARVLRPDGLYRLEWTNPFVHGVWDDWDDRGYHLSQPYADGAEIVYADPCWDFRNGEGQPQRVQGPREWRHGLGAVVNGLIRRGFAIRGLWEYLDGDPAAERGTWEHTQAFAPPWLTLWARYRPG
jgi:SAM-dependent methyltransferase